MGVYKLYFFDGRNTVAKCWAESKKEADQHAVEMFGPWAWAEEDDNDEMAKKAS